MLSARSLDCTGKAQEGVPPPKPCFENFSYKFPVTCDLSVIVPVYNTERYLAECLGSIVGQKVDFDMEVVVVNDGSSDGSLNVIKNFAAKDARIRVIDQANRGFSGARNVAIDAIRGGCCALWILTTRSPRPPSNPVGRTSAFRRRLDFCLLQQDLRGRT